MSLFRLSADIYATFPQELIEKVIESPDGPPDFPSVFPRHQVVDPSKLGEPVSFDIHNLLGHAPPMVP